MKFAQALLLGSAAAFNHDKLNENEMIQMSQFFGGYLEAFDYNINILDLLMCIRDEDNAAIAAYMSVEELEKAYQTKNPQDAVIGVIAAVAAFK